ncbi:hypothetical protein VPDG_00008 [Vibrio phage henriette 12B8]|uniref:HNH endonuclease n=1 Tax=Vibrio phage henriette 12B8 TaxID=573174 RepID=UPI0002C0CD68|nr:HNH endonuclease [Vibrio phage henriette 12B8]AGG58170.1 hypothetical protein VPDG_00008 [Vibrio phage henriette 12B8]
MKFVFIDGKATMYAFDDELNLINTKTWKKLKRMDWSGGYKMYNIYTGTHKTRRRILVHRLIANVFMGMPLDSKMTVNHIDGDKSNNVLSNLEILSVNDNIKHAFNTGLSKGKSFRSFITDDGTGYGSWYPSINQSRKDGFNPGNVHDALSKGIKLHGYAFIEM